MVQSLNKKYILRKKDFIKSFPKNDLDSPNNPYREDLSFFLIFKCQK